MPVGRLGELTALTTGATTRMVDRLEQAGYVRRVPDPADRRRVIVEPRRGADASDRRGVRPARRCGAGSARDGIGRRRRRAVHAYLDERSRRAEIVDRDARAGRGRCEPSARHRRCRCRPGRPRRSRRRRVADSSSSPARPSVIITTDPPPGRRPLPRAVRWRRPERPRPRRRRDDPLPALRLVRLPGARGRPAPGRDRPLARTGRTSCSTTGLPWAIEFRGGASGDQGRPARDPARGAHVVSGGAAGSGCRSASRRGSSGSASRAGPAT